MLKHGDSNESNNYAIKVETGGIPLILTMPWLSLAKVKVVFWNMNAKDSLRSVFEDAEFLIAVRGLSMYPK